MIETAPLKKFATWARSELLSQVEARLTTVLAEHSLERKEHPAVIKGLENEIARLGRDLVKEEAAYIWFNRIVAFRFMDANGYTSPAIVSSPGDDSLGQPEILSDAKSGQFDSAIKSSTQHHVLSLLAGSIPSNDPQGEAYLRLLLDHCAYRATSMPFLFESEDQAKSKYINILAPSNLLASDSVIARATAVLTTAVCQDVEVIGWLYQFYNSDLKDEVFAGFKKNKKATATEIPPATQLFTPHWIVRYLVENSIGRLWLLNYPDSSLRDHMEYYIEPENQNETDFLSISSPMELTVIDPACGSGHMLTYAFDLLFHIYEEEGYSPSEIPSLILEHNLFGLEIDPRAGSLASFALMMKARSKQRTFLKDGKRVEPKIRVIKPISFDEYEIEFLSKGWLGKDKQFSFWNYFENADTLGSLMRPEALLVSQAQATIDLDAPASDLLMTTTLIKARDYLYQAELLTRQYAVTIANPPYMRNANMSSLLSAFAKENYPNSRSDLFAMFIERSLALTREFGCTSMITMQSWMFLSSYETLREQILHDSPLVSMLHLGEHAFDSIGGAVVSTTAFVLSPRISNSYISSFVRAIDGANETQKNEIIRNAASDKTISQVFTQSSEVLVDIPGSPIVYWLPEALRNAFSQGTSLSQIANPRVGLQTGDNNRFLRLWWEVSADQTALNCGTREDAIETGARWFPYNKGGEFRKWYGNQEFVVNWENDGEELFSLRPKSVIRSPQTYFSPSVSWSKVSSGEPAFRQFPEGFIYDVAGTSIFAITEDVRNGLAAFTNSSVALELLKAIAPTLNYEVGQIAQLPIIPITSPEILDNVRELTATSKKDWDDFETSWDFSQPSWLRMASQEKSDVELEALFELWSNQNREIAIEQQKRETINNRLIAEAYELEGEVATDVSNEKVSLGRNIHYRFKETKTAEDYATLERKEFARELISFAVGCSFGRFSLEKTGFILDTSASSLDEYWGKTGVAENDASFKPDVDNVLPVIDGDWFEDGIVTQIRLFLRAAFGEKFLTANVQFLEEALGVKALGDYFIAGSGKVRKSAFYEDHLKRYRKRPIYWMFSSPTGAFNALIYLHRYTPSTASTVLNGYLREYQSKLDTAIKNLESKVITTDNPREKAQLEKEIDRLRKIFVELDEYEHDVLFPLASESINLDLNDGVKENYEKLGEALRKLK